MATTPDSSFSPFPRCWSFSSIEEKPFRGVWVCVLEREREKGREDITMAPTFSRRREEAREPLQFPVPVDSEHKSKALRIWSFFKPHHMAFQLSWISFFVAFFATFTGEVKQGQNLLKRESPGNNEGNFPRVFFHLASSHSRYSSWLFFTFSSTFDACHSR